MREQQGCSAGAARVQRACSERCRGAVRDVCSEGAVRVQGRGREGAVRGGCIDDAVREGGVVRVVRGECEVNAR